MLIVRLCLVCCCGCLLVVVWFWHWLCCVGVSGGLGCWFCLDCVCGLCYGVRLGSVGWVLYCGLEVVWSRL